MTKRIYDDIGMRLIRTEEAAPVCGQDFCDSCGDCLSCCSEDDCCVNGAAHLWIQYGETL